MGPTVLAPANGHADTDARQSTTPAPSGAPWAPFVLPRRYEWFVAEEGEFAGFAIEVRTNPTPYEWRVFREGLERAETEGNTWELVGPWVRAWNAYAADDGGEPYPLPPPCEDWSVLEKITGPMATWLTVQVALAPLGGKVPSGSSAPSADEPPPSPAATPAKPRESSTSATRRSPRKSPTPSASATTG